MFPALFSIVIGLLIGDVAHHWIYNWEYWYDTWILMGLTAILLAAAWWNADNESFMQSLK